MITGDFNRNLVEKEALDLNLPSRPKFDVCEAVARGCFEGTCIDVTKNASLMVIGSPKDETTSLQFATPTRSGMISSREYTLQCMVACNQPRDRFYSDLAPDLSNGPEEYHHYQSTLCADSCLSIHMAPK